MVKNKIKQLAGLSYKENNLDKNRVSRIVKALTRSELREYLREIKYLENKKTVTVSVPKNTDFEGIKKETEKLFPGKKVIIEEDNSLIAGIRIEKGDILYDFNLKNELNNIVSYISQ